MPGPVPYSHPRHFAMLEFYDDLSAAEVAMIVFLVAPIFCAVAVAFLASQAPEYPHDGDL